MSELLLNQPTGSKQEVNAYFDGARAGIRLWAWWKDGQQYVGSTGTKLEAALDMLEGMRQTALEAIDD